MKQTIKISVLLLLTTLLISCGLFANFGKGSVQINIAGVAPSGIGDTYARIYMTADGELYPMDAESGYLAAKLNDPGITTIIIEGIPVGPRYRVLLSTGILKDGWFETQQWGESAEFELEQGQNTEVSITWQWPSLSPVTDMMGKDLKGIVFNVEYGSFYTAENRRVHLLHDISSTLELFDSYDLAEDPWEFGVQDVTINSLSQGNSMGFSTLESWINSNRGIIPFENVEGWIFLPAFSQNLGAVSVAESGVVPEDPDYKVFYRKSGGIGGTNVSPDVLGSPGLWTWVSKDLQEVTDLVVTDQYAYYASAGKGVRVGTGFLAPPYSLSANRVDFTVPANILSLSYRPLGVAPDELFMGTDNGVWSAQLNEASPSSAIGTPVRIPGTEGYRFHMVADSETSNYAAFLAAHDLFVYEVGSTLLRRFSIAAGFPGQIRAMIIADVDGDWTLLVAGEEGLVKLKMLDIFILS